MARARTASSRIRATPLPAASAAYTHSRAGSPVFGPGSGAGAYRLVNAAEERFSPELPAVRTAVVSRPRCV